MLLFTFSHSQLENTLYKDSIVNLSSINSVFMQKQNRSTWVRNKEKISLDNALNGILTDPLFSINLKEWKNGK